MYIRVTARVCCQLMTISFTSAAGTNHLPARFKEMEIRHLRSTGILRSIEWYLFSDVSGQPIGPIFKGKELLLPIWRAYEYIVVRINFKASECLLPYFLNFLVCVYKYIYIYIYIHTYTHTHTHTYILESNPHPFYSFRGLKNQMRIRIACRLNSRS